jgi:hypothetical protein
VDAVPLFGNDMTADEWLEANRVQPWELSGIWHWGPWGPVSEYDPDDPRNEPHFLLPDSIFNLLQGSKGYPNIRQYLSREKAMDDFRQAYAKVNDPTLY